MTTPLQLDSYHYKCRNCRKPHVGPTRTLDFQCIKEQQLVHGLERIHEADFAAMCDCGQPVKITFQVREYPEGNFSYLGCRSADADMLLGPKVREHMVFVDV